MADGVVAADPADASSPTSRQKKDGRRVLLAAPRGFCAGVDRAVTTVEKALELYGAPIYVRRQIVHNKHVVHALEQRGAIFVEEIEDIPEDSIVITSAHGVAPSVHQAAKRSQLATIDATCPLVTKVHNEARRYAEDGYDILLIGQEGHDEVLGTLGQVPEHIHLVSEAGDAVHVSVRDERKVVWLSQTTLSMDETEKTVTQLKRLFPLLESPPSDDICYAAQNRQGAVRRMAPECDLVIVIGSKDSHNSSRLVTVALEYGAGAAYLVDCAEEVEEDWLRGASAVGVTSGASVPEFLVGGVLKWLAERGYDEVDIVRTATESQKFAFPRELGRSRDELLRAAHGETV
ncbi:4-hydroxy-3-methylbut-2-enyl diphosphate reductase [Streptomyces sp. NBC_01077]|uniref:4-hydroxy-3-methylbut-2-enyl diphosphate reductase n=1 Tax=Streptomyces sp. NBC_01077 TaxID=2903746 RepID=UPI0038689A6E|nr:4-hydroxy-3-methylbut-2-enyl diphosphate reductase [Streptomyces sp. NBC_01077]WSV43714.1 4-hydroxy-3-methylbut-2-enyl diphosphate reductase [Streptomyces sp. NBC_01077]